MIKSLLIAAAFASLMSHAAFAQSPTPAPAVAAPTTTAAPAKAKRTASPKLLACAQDWQSAKADEAVRAAGWPKYWSECSKRRADEFPSTRRSRTPAVTAPVAPSQTRS